MVDPYLGEIRMFAGNFAPAGWALCEGQTLNISNNETLFQFIGTTYGGDGISTFCLPDLRGRVPVHQGGSIVLGEKAGVEAVALTQMSLPTHSHQATASSESGNKLSPANAVWAVSELQNYSTGIGSIPVAMNVEALSFEGGNQPHDNMMPSLAISFIIALSGVVPFQE